MAVLRQLRVLEYPLCFAHLWRRLSDVDRRRTAIVARCGRDQAWPADGQQRTDRAWRRPFFSAGLAHLLLAEQRVGQHLPQEVLALLLGPVEFLEHLWV